MKQISLKILTVLFFVLTLAACDAPGPTGGSTTKLVRHKQSITAWDRMANNFQINTHYKHQRVQRFIKMYSGNEAQNLIKFSHQATPYLYHVVTTLEDRGMPSELALLPIVESEYKPNATSNRGAMGLWQLCYTTGRNYGLKRDQWHDGRKDVEAATNAALKMLQALSDQFDGDWLLALAAYNAGPGRIEQAIRHNKRIGKPTDYWSLSLPKETLYFVPKFLALVYLVEHSHELNIKLAPIPNEPYFTKVTLNAPIDLQKAAHLAKVDVHEVKRLNPGLISHVTHPNGPHQILLPVKHAHIFRANFIPQAKSKKKTAANTHANKAKTAKVITATAKTNKAKTAKVITATAKTNKAKTAKVITAKATTTDATLHTVNTGDTLVIIAAKYSTTVKAIKHKNNLKSDIIRHGQQLVI